MAHSGVRSGRAGLLAASPNLYSYSSLRQGLTLPDQMMSANLDFWLYQLAGSSQDNDLQYVMVLDSANIPIETLYSGHSDARVWEKKSFDLGKYAGRTIKLHFGVYNDGYGGTTGLLVDDVVLTVCK